MNKAFILCLALAGCLGASAAESARFMTIYIQDKPFRVEVADTPEKHARGLMFRRCLRDDFGMLFVFPDEEIRSFWMKNTLVPLDMIFLNSGGQVVGMHESVPPCEADPCPGYESALPARYVLEVTGGTAKKLKLKAGDKIFMVID
jgi:hypothetical protein